mmetsp:Transcript_8087/g.18771  ORF Transcript_8087/g.18771 Transcript_8087/m.18771 type:complete len:557 (-) Transcript_8087:49-1719(-)
MKRDASVGKDNKADRPNNEAVEKSRRNEKEKDSMVDQGVSEVGGLQKVHGKYDEPESKRQHHGIFASRMQRSKRARLDSSSGSSSDSEGVDTEMESASGQTNIRLATAESDKTGNPSSLSVGDPGKAEASHQISKATHPLKETAMEMRRSTLGSTVDATTAAQTLLLATKTSPPPSESDPESFASEDRKLSPTKEQTTAADGQQLQLQLQLPSQQQNSQQSSTGFQDSPSSPLSSSIEPRQATDPSPQATPGPAGFPMVLPTAMLPTAGGMAFPPPVMNPSALMAAGQFMLSGTSQGQPPSSSNVGASSLLPGALVAAAQQHANTGASSAHRPSLLYQRTPAGDPSQQQPPTQADRNQQASGSSLLLHNAAAPFPPAGILAHPQHLFPVGPTPPTRPQPTSAPSAPGRRGPVLYMPTDDDVLAENQILLRKQIEFFEAQLEDVGKTTSGRRRPIMLGQVGIQCRHCGDLPIRYRQRGSVYYPAKLKGIYQAAQNMAVTHLCESCEHIDPETRKQLRAFQQGRSTTGHGGKEYWAKTARVQGVIDTDEGGLRYAPQT